MRFEKIKNLKAEEFRRLTGVKSETFQKMVEIIDAALREKKSKGGRPNKLSPADMILMTLEYLREYRTYFHISTSYDVSESNCYYNIRFVENTLIKSGYFNLPGRKALVKSDVEYEVILVDATESPVERPKKKQKHYYSGKKKRHTLKTQVIVNKATTEIICTNYRNGKCHDYRLFKESKVGIHPKIKVAVDTGYQGLQKMHTKTVLPKKKSKKHPLTKDDKKENTALAKERVLVENVIGMLKRFKIISDRYRNRRKRFGLRFSLLAGLYNYELKI